MLARDHHDYTHAEYFSLEEQADYKSEYRQGKIVAMKLEESLVIESLGVEIPIERLYRNVSWE